MDESFEMHWENQVTLIIALVLKMFPNSNISSVLYDVTKWHFYVGTEDNSISVVTNIIPKLNQHFYFDAEKFLV